MSDFRCDICGATAMLFGSFPVAPDKGVQKGLPLVIPWRACLDPRHADQAAHAARLKAGPSPANR
jgi:hypothetical protein